MKRLLLICVLLAGRAFAADPAPPNLKSMSDLVSANYITMLCNTGTNQSPYYQLCFLDSSSLASAMAQKKSWAGTVTTNGSGAWSADYTSAGFSIAPAVSVTCNGGASTAASITNASFSAVPTSTGVSGVAGKPTLAVLGLISLTLVPSGTTCDVIAIEK